MNTNNYAELAEKARRIRINALKAIHAAKSGHPGGSLSSADILATLYFGELNIDPSKRNDDAQTGGQQIPRTP